MMRWPPKQVCKRIAGLLAHCGGGSTNAHERQAAQAALQRLQSEFELSDTATAFIAESDARKTANVFDIVLDVVLSTKVVLGFEQAVVVVLWTLHTYVYDCFFHTPRLLVESNEPGCGKTALAHLMRALACNAFYSSSVSPAVIYHELCKCQHTALILDEVEHSKLWDRDRLLLAVFDAGHRRGGCVHRLINGEVIEFPVFAPLMMTAVSQQPFPRQLLSRSILLHMENHPHGRDEVDPDNPEFLPIRAVLSQFASEFRRPKDCVLPPKLVGREGATTGDR